MYVNQIYDHNHVISNRFPYKSDLINTSLLIINSFIIIIIILLLPESQGNPARVDKIRLGRVAIC